ncbi:signal transducer and activator of transcription 1-like isoform X1, partial [Tachysurus ichikawai]
QPQTHSVKPYRKSDLINLSFPDVIRNYMLMDTDNIPENPLLYLYPDIPKDVAFGHYYSSTSDASEDMDVDKPFAPNPYLQRRIISVSDPEGRLQDRILPLSPEDFGVLQSINKNNGMDDM